MDVSAYDRVKVAVITLGDLLDDELFHQTLSDKDYISVYTAFLTLRYLL